MARSNRDALQATYLNDLRKQWMTVTVYLTTGLPQTGMIESFDQHAVLLRRGGTTELIYKHIIASIMAATKAHRTSSPPPSKEIVRRQDRPAVPVITRKVTRRTIVREP